MDVDTTRPHRPTGVRARHQPADREHRLLVQRSACSGCCSHLEDHRARRAHNHGGTTIYLNDTFAIDDHVIRAAREFHRGPDDATHVVVDLEHAADDPFIRAIIDATLRYVIVLGPYVLNDDQRDDGDYNTIVNAARRQLGHRTNPPTDDDYPLGRRHDLA